MISQKRPNAGIGVMILRNNKVLLGKRHKDPKKADSELHGEGTWTMPGGKLEFGESFKETAKREVFEETGIEIKEDNLRVISVTNDIAQDAHFVTVGLFCEKFKGEPEVKEPDEITEWRWFSLNKLPDLVFPPSKKILKNYSEKVFYKY